MKTEYKILAIKNYWGYSKEMHELQLSSDRISIEYWGSFLTDNEYTSLYYDNKSIPNLIEFIINKGWKLVNVTRSYKDNDSNTELIEYHFIKEDNRLQQ